MVCCMYTHSRGSFLCVLLTVSVYSQIILSNGVSDIDPLVFMVIYTRHITPHSSLYSGIPSSRPPSRTPIPYHILTQHITPHQQVRLPRCHHYTSSLSSKSPFSLPLPQSPCPLTTPYLTNPSTAPKTHATGGLTPYQHPPT